VTTKENTDLNLGSNKVNRLIYTINTFKGFDTEKYAITNGINEIEFLNSGSGYYSIEPIDLGIDTKIQSKATNESISIPVLVNQPISIGKITFEFNSFKLNSNAKLALKEIAKEIKKSGFTGVYLVGNADRTGNVEANKVISQLRVKSVKEYLTNFLDSLNYSNVNITTENMADYFATGQKGRKNENDRSVTFLIYPL
jgi:outer membrane protein OmpA-like peptidoglycan-associated protein